MSYVGGLFLGCFSGYISTKFVIYSMRHVVNSVILTFMTGCKSFAHVLLNASRPYEGCREKRQDEREESAEGVGNVFQC